MTHEEIDKMEAERDLDKEVGRSASYRQGGFKINNEIKYEE